MLNKSNVAEIHLGMNAAGIKLSMGSSQATQYSICSKLKEIKITKGIPVWKNIFFLISDVQWQAIWHPVTTA